MKLFEGLNMEQARILYESIDTLTVRYFRSELVRLERELMSIRQGTHPKLPNMFHQIDDMYEADVARIKFTEKLETERINQHYRSEARAAEKELEERLTELMETLIQECEEQRRRIEHERHNSDISSAPSNDFPNKKSLRRRPNEPASYDERQMQARANPNIVYELTEQQIEEDLILASQCLANN